jgi:hypothetical protein
MQQMKHEFGRCSDTCSDWIIVFKSALNWPTWNSSTLKTSWIVPSLDRHFKLSLCFWPSRYQQRLADLIPRTSWKQPYDTRLYSATSHRTTIFILTAAQYQASHDPADDNEEYTQYTKYMPTLPVKYKRWYHVQYILPEKYKSRCHVQFLGILNNAINYVYKAPPDLTAWGKRPCGSGGPQIYRTLIH